jgi:hypothetical protein
MSDSALDCELAGARLCATHQPQHTGKLRGIRRISAVRSCEAAAAGLRHSRAPWEAQDARLYGLDPLVALCRVAAGQTQGNPRQTHVDTQRRLKYNPNMLTLIDCELGTVFCYA